MKTFEGKRRQAYLWPCKQSLQDVLSIGRMDYQNWTFLPSYNNSRKCHLVSKEQNSLCCKPLFQMSCEATSLFFSPASCLIEENSINLTFILFSIFNTPSLSDHISLLGKTTGSTTHLRIVCSRKINLLRNRDALCTFKGRHLLGAVLRGRQQVTAEGMPMLGSGWRRERLGQMIGSWPHGCRRYPQPGRGWPMRAILP